MVIGCFLLNFLVLRVSQNVVLLHDLENLNVTTMITAQQKIKTDHLVKILQECSQQHLIQCIKDKCQHIHWSMHFTYSNLAVSAVCMVCNFPGCT
jgi:hypothetical protein